MDPTAICEQFWKDLFLDISKLLSLTNDTGVGWLCRGWALHWGASVWVSGLILRLSPSRQTDLFHSWEQNTVVIWQIVQHGRRADRTWEAGSWKAFRKKPWKLLGLLWWLKLKRVHWGHITAETKSSAITAFWLLQGWCQHPKLCFPKEAFRMDFPINQTRPYFIPTRHCKWWIVGLALLWMLSLVSFAVTEFVGISFGLS